MNILQTNVQVKQDSTIVFDPNIRNVFGNVVSFFVKQ